MSVGVSRSPTPSNYSTYHCDCGDPIRGAPTVETMAWVYMLKCADDSFYVGSTRNLDGRMEQHASGKGAKYTSTRLPVVLIWACETERVDEAYGLEKQIQGWSRAKRQALVDGRFGDLRALSGSAFRRADQRRDVEWPRDS